MKKQLSFLLIALLIAVSPVVYAQDQASAARIKAAYINQFSHFVQWPGSAGSLKNSLSICVLGVEDVSKELQPLTQVADNDFDVKLHVVSRLEKIDRCNMLYIASSENGNLEAVLNYVNKKPILTISSIDDFASKGGMIGFVIAGNKVRLEINRGTVKKSGLRISARLLEVSKIIETEKNKERK